MPGYGRWGKHVELFSRYESFRDDPRVQEMLMQEAFQGGPVRPGSGAPEGRADFPLYLQTVIRHTMRERFQTVAAKWDSYMGVESALDFREHTVSQINGILGIGDIQEDGEYPKMRTSETPGPSFAVGKHGGTYDVTMELVINDQVDYILNRTPRELGRTMAEYISRVVVAFIESDPTYTPDGEPYFSEAHENNVVGEKAEPNEANLLAALDIMQLRRAADSHTPFTVNPQRILVRAPSHKARFDAIIRSQLTGVRQDAPANPGFGVFFAGNYNPAFNVLPPDAVVQEPWLNTPQDWYIFGDAADRPPFVIAFLQGNQTPFIGLRDPMVRDAFSNTSDPYSWWFDAISFKLRHFFGVAAGEPMAAMRMVPS
jgi:hypothetical protein